MSQIKAGTWVEIERIVLNPENRVPGLPEETAKVPYVMHVSGFLIEPSILGETARIRSIIGREHHGRLIRVEPNYTHSFGRTVPEILTIGTEEESL